MYTVMLWGYAALKHLSTDQRFMRLYIQSRVDYDIKL